MSATYSRRRPAGVTLVAVLTWISAILHILLGALVLGGVLSATGVTETSAWIGLAVGVVTLLVSFGLFSGNRAARTLVAISLSLSLLAAAVYIIDAPQGLIASPIASAVTAIVGLLLLYSRPANTYFRS